MIISRNLASMTTNRILNSNISSHAKSTEKVSSGYKINIAVDNPVGLAMSETMRRQIRGLMQGTNNTKDGVAFVQIADGAMSEIHDMLQRMNELSIRAADGLCTAVDRVALNAELDQLRTEIDRINSNTTFNELPVFEEHEASYYQICGNKQWSDNERHTITESANELNIHLPDGYVPKDYTITVPAGTYTTQELMDEIDDALDRMSPPNPGFVFEYTSDGYCNLNFENADGKPTKIEFVDGSLAYLIYDFENGGSPATLLGTTEFNPGQKLEIYKGKNDELGFYAESAEGSWYISITLDPKSYTYEDLVNAINSKLDDVAEKENIPIAADIRAESFEIDGKYYIQLTGGDTINIVGLKGNMFHLELTKPTYHSVFYDNAVYGEYTKTAANISGNYHNGDDPINRITIIEGYNDTLKFKVNDNDVYEIQITPGDHTVSDIAKIINEELEVANEVTASGTNILKLENKLKGSESKLDFASYFSENYPVYEETYNTLFGTASGNSTKNEGQDAYLHGAPSLEGEINLDSDASLTFYVDNKKYYIELNERYSDINTLLSDLQSKADPNKEKIIFENRNNQIWILPNSPDVRVITIKNEDKNSTYTKLFTGNMKKSDGSSSSSGGYVETGTQGDLSIYPIGASLENSNCKENIIIDENTNELIIKLSFNSQITDEIKITLDSRSYTIATLADEIRSKIGTNKITVTCRGNSIIFGNYKPKDNDNDYNTNDKWAISTSGSAWDAIFKTSNAFSPHIEEYAKDAELISFSHITNDIKIDGSNNYLNLKINGGEYELTLEQKTYTRDDLLDKLKELEKIGIGVSYNQDNQIVFTALNGKFEPSGSFYVNVMCKEAGTLNIPKNGECIFKPTGENGGVRIIGRKDLINESIKIEKDVNDQLTFDFTYPYNGETRVLSMTITLPPGEYQDGIALFGHKDHPNDELRAIIEKQIEEYDKDDPYYDEIQRLFGKSGCFDLNFLIGGRSTDAFNSVDGSALQISVKPREGKDVPEPDEGQYILDGVRGSAAPFVFYKTTSLPTASYIIGTKNVMNGITIEPGKNILTLSANSVPYEFVFPENTFYTADELINELNRQFAEKKAPLQASLENGAVKISHKIFGANTITDISGSARSTIFFEEEGRDERDPLILQVGAEQKSTIELPRIIVNSCSLGINSITLSTQKYADKAINRIKGAINLLNSRRSTYGAMQNRLEHTINNNENITESVQKTESLIRDTDVSSEMIRYSNLSILLKAGQNAIAESNKKIEKLLTLLQ